MNTAQINFSVVDQSYSPTIGLNGISGYIGTFKRGPIGKNDEVFSSWTRFKKIYGDLIATSDDPLIVKRMLEAGSKVRVCGVKHSDAAVAVAASAYSNAGGDELFQLVPKYPGADYNNLKVTILTASNGQANYFDLKIELLSDPNYTPEYYSNINISGTPDVASSNYLKDVVSGSELVNVVYKDLSALVAPLNPTAKSVTYADGSDGTAVVDGDYVGASDAKTGLYAFDGVSDIYAIGSSNVSSTLVVAGSAYAAARMDLQYFYHFDNSLKTAAQIIAAKAAFNIDTPYIEFWAGGLNVLDPLTNLRKDISAIGDILAAAAKSEATEGAYRSFAGINRGLVRNAFGVVNNFGSSSDLTNLNLLSNRQINAVINVDNQIYLSGNFSGQLATSHLSFNNVVRLIIYIQRTLRPLCKQFIEEPNDIPTWKKIFLTCKPSMDSLVSPKRALFNYDWQGDQFAASLDDLKINNANDVGLGKYLVILSIKDIVSLQEFSIKILITPSSVSFEDALTLI